LSIVIQGRNDNYAGQMVGRLNNMISTASLMAAEADLPIEIILVEWNPPLQERPIAEEILRSPEVVAHAPVRIITVPGEVHRQVPHHKAHPIFEHIAENVAFRRARGEFVLKTNIDNIMSPNTMQFLARRELRQDTVYRATYLEYDVILPNPPNPKEVLDWLFAESKLKDQARERYEELQPKYQHDTQVCTENDADWDNHPGATNPFYWAGSGDFVLTSLQNVFDAKGYPQIAQNYNTDDLIHCRLRKNGIKQVVLLPPCVTVHQNHRRINRVRANSRWIVDEHNFPKICEDPFAPLPTDMALGDDWGYPDHHFQETVL